MCDMVRAFVFVFKAFWFILLSIEIYASSNLTLDWFIASSIEVRIEVLLELLTLKGLADFLFISNLKQN